MRTSIDTQGGVIIGKDLVAINTMFTELYDSFFNPLFGDYPGGNYVEIEEDGTIVLYGDATVWEDLNFSVEASGGPAVSEPDDVTVNGVFHREFTSGNNQKVGSSREIPHEAMLGKTLYPHIHFFLKSGESAGTTGVTFTFNWELRQKGGTTFGSVDLSAASADLSTDQGANNWTASDTTGFDGPSVAQGLGAQLSVTIARTAGDAGDVIPTTYGVHYEKDGLGSRSITGK